VFFKSLSHKNILLITFFPAGTTHAANTNPDHLMNIDGLSPGGKAAEARSVPKSRTVEQYLHSPHVFMA
jgi:hypothetical protein